MKAKPKIFLNNIWSTIEDLPPGARECLYEELSFNIPNATFIRRNNEEKYENWDGKKHLFQRTRSKTKGTFPSGLLARVIKSCGENFKISDVQNRC